MTCEVGRSPVTALLLLSLHAMGHHSHLRVLRCAVVLDTERVTAGSALAMAPLTVNCSDLVEAGHLLIHDFQYSAGPTTRSQLEVEALHLGISSSPAPAPAPASGRASAAGPKSQQQQQQQQQGKAAGGGGSRRGGRGGGGGGGGKRKG